MMNTRVSAPSSAALRIASSLLAASLLLLSACSTLEPIADLALQGRTEPLMDLIRSGRIGVDDAQPWSQGDTKRGATPLCAAISGGRQDAVRELLLRGADANKGCTPQHTPLDWTIETFYQPAALDIANLLLERGAVTSVYRDIHSLADVEQAMARKNSAIGEPIRRKS
jgi:ankyrin repeat protein